MTDQITSIEQAEQMIRDNRREIGEETLASDVREYFNCREASVDDQGDIWIADPQVGHWCTAEEKLGFINWNLARS